MDLKAFGLDNKKFIAPNHEFISFSGRIDFSEPLSPVFVFPGSSISINFTGTSAGIIIRNKHNWWRNFLGFIIDGERDEKIEIPKNDEAIFIPIVQNLENKSHSLTIFKRMDGCHYFDFLGLVLDEDGELLPPPPKPQRRIECYGDSVSAGEVSEAIDFVGKSDPEHTGEFSNSWYSYSMMTARMLDAEIHNIAQGGIALLDGTGYFPTGMLCAYDKIQYNPNLGELKSWDFSLYTPHVVIIAIGQNDAHPENYINTDMEKRKAWKEGYKKLVRSLREKYPKATIILQTTLLFHDKGWDDCIEEAKSELCDPKVYHFLYKRNGSGTPGHLRIPEAEEMAKELSTFINSLGEEIWR